MKIIKDGDQNKAAKKLKQTKRFECSVCGCVFEADKGEYTPCMNQFDYSAHAECPCCKQRAYEIRTRRV